MPQSQFLYLREIVRSAVETRHESADILLLARNLRARAEEALALAEIFDSPHTRQMMRGIAGTYEKLAERLEMESGGGLSRGAVDPIPRRPGTRVHLPRFCGRA